MALSKQVKQRIRVNKQYRKQLRDTRQAFKKVGVTAITPHLGTHIRDRNSAVMTMIASRMITKLDEYLTPAKNRVVFKIKTDNEQINENFKEGIRAGSFIAVSGQSGSYVDSLSFELMLSLVVNNPMKPNNGKKPLILHYSPEYDPYSRTDGRHSALMPSLGLINYETLKKLFEDSGYRYADIRARDVDAETSFENIKQIVSKYEEAGFDVVAMILSDVATFHHFGNREIDVAELAHCIKDYVFWKDIVCFYNTRLSSRGIRESLRGLDTKAYFDTIREEYERQSPTFKSSSVEIYTRIDRRDPTQQTLGVCFAKMQPDLKVVVPNPIIEIIISKISLCE